MQKSGTVHKKAKTANKRMPQLIWWTLNDYHEVLRNFKRTISNKKTANGIEQIDLMPDVTSRRAVWKGAKTLDDLRKTPDEVTNESQK